MGLCGYNEKIGAGIRTLIEGMIEAMLAKDISKHGIRSIVEIELAELEASNRALSTRPDMLGYLDGFLAINRFAQVLFVRAAEQLERSGDWSPIAFKSACELEGNALVNAMRTIDQQHRVLKSSRTFRLADTSAISDAIIQFYQSEATAQPHVAPRGSAVPEGSFHR